MNELSAYSPERPLLLVTDYPPDVGGGGGVILRSLLDASARQRILWASPSLDPAAAQRHQNAVPLASASGMFSSWLNRRSLALDSLLAGRLADEIVQLAERRRAAAIWIVLHGAMVHAAARLLDRTRLPVHVSVHDDPPFGVALMSRRYIGLIPLIARDLGRALRRARSIDVISAGMARWYRSRYGVESVVVHRGLGRTVLPSPHHDPSRGLEIGVLGNTYGHSQLCALSDVLALAAARCGVRGRIVVIGQGHGMLLRDYARDRIDVEVAGHLDEDAAIARLQGCFLLYLNYPFSRRAAVLRQTSFPTKLSTYVFAARPVLLHAPPDSSTAELAAKRGYVLWWENENPEHGLNLLAAAWNDGSLHSSCDRMAEEVRRRYYDIADNRTTLFHALNSLIPRDA
jgi:hypothetical protein